MKTREISLQDIQAGKIWRAINTELDNWLDWCIEETKRIRQDDVIVHSALVVVDNRRVLPFIQTKYYEDGGEIGEMAIFIDGCWNEWNANLQFDKVEGPYLAFVSTLDIHEFQKECFDNRKEHRHKFQHYVSQINVDGIVPFIEAQKDIPLKLQKMPIDGLIAYIKTTVAEIEQLRVDNKISKSNKLVDKLLKVINFTKQNPANYCYLKTLLSDHSPAVVGWLQYQLVDLFERECLSLIRKKAKEDSIEGMGAKYWLKEHKLG